MMPFLNLQRIKIANVTNKLNVVFLIEWIKEKAYAIYVTLFKIL